MFGIAEFSSIIARRGLGKPTHYCVTFTPPGDINEQIVDDLPFLVDSTNLPGIQFSTETYRHKGYGHQDKRANDTTFEDITMTIIGDGQGKVLGFLNNWLNKVQNTNGDGTNRAAKFGAPVELFNYPDEYQGVMQIYLYDITGSKYQVYTMNKAWPMNIAGVVLGWGQTDSLMQISVTFSYRSYEIETLQTSSGDFSINNYTGNNSYRNVNAIENLLANPNIDDYAARFEAF